MNGSSGIVNSQTVDEARLIGDALHNHRLPAFKDPADDPLAAAIADAVQLAIRGRVVVDGPQNQFAAFRVEQRHHAVLHVAMVVQFLQHLAQGSLHIQRMSQDLADTE